MSGRTVGKGPTQGSPTQCTLPPQTDTQTGQGWEGVVTNDPSQGPTRLCCLNGNENANFLFLQNYLEPKPGVGGRGRAGR